MEKMFDKAQEARGEIERNADVPKVLEILDEILDLR